MDVDKILDLFSGDGGEKDLSKNISRFPKYILSNDVIVSFYQTGQTLNPTLTDKEGNGVFAPGNTKVEGLLGKGTQPLVNKIVDLFNNSSPDSDVVILKEIPPPPKETVTPPVPYSFEGKVISTTEQTPLSQVEIEDNQNPPTSVTSNKKGEFKIKGSYYKSELLELTFSLEDYGTETYTITDLNGDIRKDLKVIKLKTTKENLKEEERKELLIPQNQLKQIKSSKMDAEMAQQEAMNQLMTTIKTVLIPAVLVLIAAFGISKIKEAINKKFGDLNATCPANIDELNRLIAKKNRLVKQLNNIYKTLKRIKVGVSTIDGILSASQITLGALKIATIVIPSVPGAPDPTKSTFLPDGPMDKISKEIKKYKLISSTTLIILTILTGALQTVLALLALLDSLIQGCAKEISSEDGQVDREVLTQTQVSQELIASTQNQSNQLSPVVTNVNGFNMEVETEITGDPLKRRRAIAKNTQGVAVLKGEYSYSSNDQILIDELVFYIEQNDLKAE